MAFQRVVARVLPDKSVQKVYPFHISLKGMESTLLCRCDDDFDHLEKSFYVSSYMANCLVIIGIVMSNHGHCAVLATDLASAVRAGELIKKRHSQYLSWKYPERKVMMRADINVQHLDSEWYVRNALAYIARNAIDTGHRVEDYRWSGYRGMFAGGMCQEGVRRVSMMSRREREALFHTHEDLSDVPWIINEFGSVEPASACDYRYLESAFGNDQAFFLKMIGSVNVAEMTLKLELNGLTRQTDSHMIAIVKNLADKWFQKTLLDLTPEMKSRLASYLYKAYRTTPAQLARCLGLAREIVETLIGHGKVPDPLRV